MVWLCGEVRQHEPRLFLCVFFLLSRFLFYCLSFRVSLLSSYKNINRYFFVDNRYWFTNATVSSPKFVDIRYQIDPTL